MALMDKMKAQAAQLAQMAQEAGKAGQSKLEEVQARRKADGLLRQLGLLTYGQITGTHTDDPSTQVDSLVKDLQTYESTYGPLSATAEDTTPDEPDAQ